MVDNSVILTISRLFVFIEVHLGKDVLQSIQLSPEMFDHLLAEMKIEPKFTHVELCGIDIFRGSPLKK